MSQKGLWTWKLICGAVCLLTSTLAMAQSLQIPYKSYTDGAQGIADGLPQLQQSLTSMYPDYSSYFSEGDIKGSTATSSGTSAASSVPTTDGSSSSATQPASGGGTYQAPTGLDSNTSGGSSFDYNY